MPKLLLPHAYAAADQVKKAKELMPGKLLTAI